MCFASVVNAAVEKAEALGKDGRWERVHNYRAERFSRKLRGAPVTYFHATE